MKIAQLIGWTDASKFGDFIGMKTMRGQLGRRETPRMNPLDVASGRRLGHQAQAGAAAMAEAEMTRAPAASGCSASRVFNR